MVQVASRVCAHVLVFGGVVAAVVPAYAQTPTLSATSTVWNGPLAGLLPDFLLDAALTAPGEADHASHFVRGLQSTVAGLELSQALAGQVGAFPVVSPSGGFAFAGPGGTGEFALTPRAPIFSQRAHTIGRGRFATAFSYHRTKSDAISGLDLDNGEINIYAPHNDCCGAGARPALAGNGTPAFEGDVLSETLGLELRQSIAVGSAVYGLTRRIDIGVLVPLVKVDVDARITARIRRIATTSTPGVHSFDGIDLANRTTHRRGSATGIGDIRVLAKYNALRTGSGGVAIGVDVTLPSGDENNLLGGGGTRIRSSLVASGERGRLSPFMSAGFTKSKGATSAFASTWSNAISTVSASVGRGIADEVDYSVGFSFASTSWLTFDVEALGHALIDAKQFAQGGPFDDGLTVAASGTVNRVLAVAGARARLTSRLLLTAGFVLPVVDRGLRPKARPIVSIDYGF